ncbi:cysteine proteinase [Annulohypoxylon truncatum]|uniref:cysteine proteinase n=1 Tax=Annulohypoxylon truncatum TaxID=327061 RepID=UPI0020085993|nr:cysteine proteinase [Annulohypoxylon truncatum]KAI1212379.1 cysteine proteinase [Annulohypoxylon truncatum]
MSQLPSSRRDLTRFGYSSSSESDEPPRKATTTTSNTQDKKKKKRRKTPPQQSINKIWRRFTTKEFTKALAVLPFDPVPLPSTPERPNELLSAGYERARDECSRKVKKIIAECKRVNTRYRDPGFDLDWDLKWLKGNCLNYLGSRKFDILSSKLSITTSVPKAVKRVHEIFEKPTFMKNIAADNVKQGSLGDCWLIASLSALANVEDGIKRMCVEYDARIGIYGFVFYRDGEWIYSIIDDKLYLTSPCWDSPSMQREMLNQIDREEPEKVYRKTYQTGSKALFFGQCKDQHETWVALLEKAYAKAHGDYGSLSGGWIGEGLEDLSGGVTTELLASDILDIDEFWENELSKVNKEFLFGCSTGLLDGGYGDRNGIREGHAYVVMDARTLKSGQRLVKLRNPWGKNRKGIWEGPWSDGSKEWNNDVKEELDHQFGNDSVFWITYEDMLEKYQHFDRTRLFMDPDWRCCQRWIGVEVPWKQQWNEKFHIKLTKESPLVLVLQQLDNRYYKGLHGQYTFRMHFRVHEQGRPDSEDYIVRSHGNYLMDRSVSIEVPCMEPGNYSVFISIVAERDTDMPSIEDVVKRECRKRVENEKLAQVGYAYDLAHSKGVAHLEQVAKLRKKSDQKKASASRMQERRKMWEKRHLNRDITKKQSKKNQEKRDKRREAEEEKRKIAEEKKKAEEEAAKVKADAEAAAKKKKEDEERAKAEAEKKKKEEAEATERKKKEEAEEEKPKDAAVQTDDLQSGEDKSIQMEEAKQTAETKDEAISSESADKPKEPEDASKDAVKDDAAVDAKTEKPKEDVAETPKEDVADAPKEETKPEEKKSEEKPDEKTSEEKPAEDKSSSGGDDASTASTAAPAPAAKTSSRQKQPPPPPAYSTDGDSSDSPVEDWELLYSSDDMSKKPRMATTQPPATTNDAAVESDGESGLPDPWNAICIVGFRVYSKDEDLDLRVVLEGGDMAENGMGEKGPADIDNAQMNAGGEREKKSQDVTDEVEIVDGELVRKEKIVAPDDDAEKKENEEDKKDEKRDDKADEEKGEETPAKDEPKEDDDNEKKDPDDEKEADVDVKSDDKDNGKDDCTKSDASDSSDESPIPTPDSTDSRDSCAPQHRLEQKRAQEQSSEKSSSA